MQTMSVNDSGKNLVDVVLGAQWGDEGKGKIVDLLAETADIVCRCQGGNNAGHTVVANGVEYDFHLLPSGIVNPKCLSIIGNGVVVHIPALFQEIEINEKRGLVGIKDRLRISDRAHIVFDFHQQADGLLEEYKSQTGMNLGTTKKGIGPCYSSKASRLGIRICDLINDFQSFEVKFRMIAGEYMTSFPKLSVDIESELVRYRKLSEIIKPMVCDTVYLLQTFLKSSKIPRIVIEGANAVMLDIDFGTYPYVTSSNCSIGGVCSGLGLAPQYIGGIYGVTKAYTTRVGDGPFPTEVPGEIGELLRSRGGEFGVTTKRPRRCGWLDIVVLRYSAMINGYTALALTKLDILDVFETIKIGICYVDNKTNEELEGLPANTARLDDISIKYVTMPGWQRDTGAITDFESLPDNAKKYVERIENLVDVPVRWIGVGKERERIIVRY